MARYIDADKIPYYLDTSEEAPMEGRNIAFRCEIDKIPTADVAPKSEVNDLEYKLIGVMHSVDKWLEGEELEQDEVNRAITMREKTLRIIENAKTEVAREIFAEIEKIILDNTYPDFNREHKPVNIWKATTGYDAFYELKKKYTEGEL